ncbi:MAG: hypothetical protein IAC51_00470 [bacterium]|uniref:Uncharacterized protein n=1 Tax=Candidatus Aphodosoma intestinipullorum TaxID=2840674 RepID=A0A940DIR2_9BACT|nr:hypothetical protein [Candidatus Aphodosoma intestinipullorum]
MDGCSPQAEDCSMCERLICAVCKAHAPESACCGKPAVLVRNCLDFAVHIDCDERPGHIPLSCPIE